jgi:hypothetical protein
MQLSLLWPSLSVPHSKRLQFDSDGDGKITRDELRNLLDAVNYQLTWDRNRDRELQPF